MNKRILIIDDDARNIFALTATLKSKGYQCISAQDAKQGLSFLSNSNDIGIILIDMMMPDMDGYQTIPEIKKRNKDVPVIAVTAQAMVGDREKCLAAGADDYISKPVDVDKLVRILDNYMK